MVEVSMNRSGLVALALCGAGTALAQDAGLSVSVGARAWYTEWTTFSYYTETVNGKDVNKALIQSSAGHKLALVPVVAVRYGNFVGTLSAFPSTRFSFANGDNGTRKEFDLNLGYVLMPGLTATLGYKKISQRDGPTRYEPAGPIFGLSGNAPLAGAYSLYGAFGLGRLKTPASDDKNVVKFKADYRLTEVGVASTFNSDWLLRRWTLTAGYRIQVMGSKEAFGTQDGRDTTQGFTFGALATF